jgi:hypothetical protein
MVVSSFRVRVESLPQAACLVEHRAGGLDRCGAEMPFDIISSGRAAGQARPALNPVHADAKV